MSALNTLLFTSLGADASLGSTIEAGPWIAYYRPVVESANAWAIDYCLGHIDPEGIKLSTTPLAEDIQSNAYGDQVIDQIFMGVDVSISFTLQQIARDTVRKLIHDWAQYPLTDGGSIARQTGYQGIIGQVGRPVTSYAGQLRIFPLHYQNPIFDNGAGAGGNGAGWHYEYVTPMNGDAIEEAMRAGLHTIPVNLRVLPFFLETAAVGSAATLCYRRSVATLTTA